MPLPGVSDEKDLKPLLKKLFESKDEVYKFAVAASAPREGQLLLDKKLPLKKKDVQQEAEAEAKKQTGKAVKMDVMTGECRLDDKNAATLRLIVNGKAPAKAVACIEHLLVRGPFKSIGFVAVLLEEIEEAPSATPTENATASPPAAPAPSAPSPASTDNAPAAAPSAELAQWEKSLAAVEPTYLKAVRDRPDDASKLRAVMGFAQGKAETEDYKSAIAGLKKLLELLGVAKAAPTPPATAPAASPQSEAQPKTDTPPKNQEPRKQPSLVQLQQARLIWEATLKKVRGERDKLVTTILAEFEDADDKAIAAEATSVIQTTLDNFNEQLLDKLDEALNATTDDERAQHNGEAATLLEGYLQQLQDEPIFAELDANPFTPVKLHETLAKSLTGLASKLA